MISSYQTYTLTTKQRRFLCDVLIHHTFSNELTLTERALIRMVISDGKYTPNSKEMLNTIRTKILLTI